MCVEDIMEAFVKESRAKCRFHTSPQKADHYSSSQLAGDFCLRSIAYPPLPIHTFRK
jgi:hypothetical protein